MKRTTWSALILLLLLASVPALASAQDDTDLKMQVEVGYDGQCRTSSWCPLRIILSNEGADVDAELVVPINLSGGPDPRSDAYARRVTLPAHSRKAYYLHVPPVGTGTRSRLAIQLRSGKQQLASRQVSVKWLDADERLYGVVSSDSSAFGFLADVAPLGGSAEVAHLELESLPPDPLAWESLDVLILNDVDTTALSDEQRQALSTWIAHGGHLVVGGGAGAVRTAAGVSDLLPVVIGGMRSVDSLQALGGYAGADPVEGPYAVAEMTIQDGVALIEQDDLLLMVRRRHGAGRVDALAFDAGLNSFADWSAVARLWDWMIGAAMKSSETFSVQDGYAAREAVNSLPGRGLPSTLHILGFLLVYVILVGPANYIVLRKLDRRELAWLTIPVLIVGFSSCAYLTGFQLRGYRAIVHRLAMVYVPDKAIVGRSYQLVGLFSPRRTNYDVWVPDARVRGIPVEYYYGGPGPRSLSLREEPEGTAIEDMRVDVGGIEPFMVEGYREVSPIDADLRLTGVGGRLWLEGTVRNGEVPLTDALIMAGYQEQRLGDLEPNEEVSIRVQLFGTMPSSGYGSDLPERILGTSSYWDDPELHRRYVFLRSLLASYSAYSYGASAPNSTNPLAAGAYLIGWAAEGTGTPLSVEVPGRAYTTDDVTLYVYALSLEELAAETGLTVPPGLVERQVVETVGEVDTYPEGFHMGSHSEITFRFTWSAIPLKQVDLLELDIHCDGYYGSRSTSPVVSLWNRETGEWDPQDVKWGKNQITDLNPYVTSASGVLVRLESGAEPIETGSLLISVEGR